MNGMHDNTSSSQNQIERENVYLRAKIEELERKLLRQDEVEKLADEHEQRFKQILELTNNGVVICSKNSGEIIEANNRLITNLKYRPEEVIGKTVFQFVLPEQHEAVRQWLAEDHLNVCLISFIDSDGVAFEYEICSQVSYYHNQSVKIAAVRDIAYRKINEETRKKAELALRTAEEKYHILTSLLPDMVIETDTNGFLTFVNLKVIDVLSLKFVEQKAKSLQKNMKFLSDSALKFLTF